MSSTPCDPVLGVRSLLRAEIERGVALDDPAAAYELLLRVRLLDGRSESSRRKMGVPDAAPIGSEVG